MKFATVYPKSFKSAGAIEIPDNSVRLYPAVRKSETVYPIDTKSVAEYPEVLKVERLGVVAEIVKVLLLGEVVNRVTAVAVCVLFK